MQLLPYSLWRSYRLALSSLSTLQQMWQWLPGLLFFMLWYIKSHSQVCKLTCENDLMRFLSVFNDSLQSSLNLCAVLFLFSILVFLACALECTGCFFPQTLAGSRDVLAQPLPFVHYFCLFLPRYSFKGKASSSYAQPRFTVTKCFGM